MRLGDPAAASTAPFAEIYAPCRDEYATAFRQQLAEHEAATSALRARIAADDRETQRVRDAYALTRTIKVWAVAFFLLGPHAARLRRCVAGRCGGATAVHADAGAATKLAPAIVPAAVFLLGDHGVLLVVVQVFNAGLMFFSGRHQASREQWMLD